MPAGVFTFYEANIDDFRVNDIVGATLKMAAVASGYTPNSGTGGHSVWADVSPSEIAAGNGYAAGGATLSGVAKTAVTGGWKVSSDNVVWTATGGAIPAARRFVLYVNGTLWGVTNPLIGHFLADDAPADIPALSDSNTRTITCPAGGWFDVVRA